MSFDTDRPPIGSSPLARGLLVSALPLGRPLGIIPARAGFTRIRLNGRTYVVGSSPLARGLRGEPGGPVLGWRIIPARAGFTTSSSPSSPPGSDHPRSRGVYPWGSVTALGDAGSSPLARGLRSRRRCRPAGTRIIPARAGFTPSSMSCCPTRRDHPRSRGVYQRVFPSLPRQEGSSPLARGLLRSAPDSESVWGIIPARAGFTRTASPTPSRGRDHPRSRGVYTATRRRTRQCPGSSPLARGLLVGRGEGFGGGRIIPARAGFTPGRPASQSSPTDHPRSRGVYMNITKTTEPRPGSSPLARGLPPRRTGSRSGRRIIPARAGFTRVSTWRRGSPGDHPRSRGVYEAACWAASPADGSSPLARGLLRWYPLRLVCGRIIPARAGFTTSSSPSSPPGSDHPRSRGVYAAAVGAAGPMEGSSPLARGLLLLQESGRQPRRIIPARAGFTLSAAYPVRRLRDHPRSRGVYSVSGVPPRTPVGSSPLARGLRGRPGPQLPAARIIPARAGFTLADPWNPNDGLPYQTAFTFTGDLAPAPPSCGSAVVSRRSTTTPSAA